MTPTPPRPQPANDDAITRRIVTVTVLGPDGRTTQRAPTDEDRAWLAWFRRPR